MNKSLPIVIELAKAFKNREKEQSYGKGITRDKALLEFFIGAANGIKVVLGEESEEFKILLNWIAFVIAIRGYKGLEQELEAHL